MAAIRCLPLSLGAPGARTHGEPTADGTRAPTVIRPPTPGEPGVRFHRLDEENTLELLEWGHQRGSSRLLEASDEELAGIFDRRLRAQAQRPRILQSMWKIQPCATDRRVHRLIPRTLTMGPTSRR